MIRPQPDDRSDSQRVSDERIAAEAPLPPPVLAEGAVPLPLEAILRSRSGNPFAIAGIVENGLVKPLDPAVRLPEHARVIIVAAQGD
jgi:hypothetical protein